MPVALGKSVVMELLMDTRTVSKEYYEGDIVVVDYVTALRWAKHKIARVTDQSAKPTAETPLETDLWAKSAATVGISEQEQELQNFIKSQGGEEALKEAMEETQKMAEGQSEAKPPEPGSRADKAEKAIAAMGASSPAEAEQKKQKRLEALEKARAAKAKKDAEASK